jgi:hypothetical protein
MHLCRKDFATADDTTVWSVEHQCTVDGVKFAERKELQVGLAHGSSFTTGDAPAANPALRTHLHRERVA